MLQMSTCTFIVVSTIVTLVARVVAKPEPQRKGLSQVPSFFYSAMGGSDEGKDVPKLITVVDNSGGRSFPSLNLGIFFRVECIIMNLSRDDPSPHTHKF